MPFLKHTCVAPFRGPRARNNSSKSILHWAVKSTVNLPVSLLVQMKPILIVNGSQSVLTSQPYALKNSSIASNTTKDVNIWTCRKSIFDRIVLERTVLCAARIGQIILETITDPDWCMTPNREICGEKSSNWGISRLQCVPEALQVSNHYLPTVCPTVPRVQAYRKEHDQYYYQAGQPNASTDPRLVRRGILLSKDQ